MKNNLSYSQNVEIIKKNIYNTKFNDLELNGYLWSYLMISANLSTFLPKLQNKLHFDVIRNMQFHRDISRMDLFYPSLLENTKFYDKNNVIEKCLEKPHIFVSYHAGPYYMIFRHLAKMKVPFCVVAGDNYIKDFDNKVQEIFRGIPNLENTTLPIYTAEDPKLLLKLNKNLKEGMSVFFFIDGNTGSKENDFNNDKNLLKINFLNHHIYARQGVAFLAYLSKTPIVTIIAKRNKKLNNIVKINLLNIKDQSLRVNRNKYINTITKKLYKVLENYLKINYEQWSGWFYVQYMFDTESPTQINDQNKERKVNFKKDKLILNDFIDLIKHNDNNIFLVMKKEYEIMRIKQSLFDVLSNFKTPKTINTDETLIINNEVVRLDYINELIELNYLKLA